MKTLHIFGANYALGAAFAFALLGAVVARKAVHLTMVVSPELKKNAYANEIQSTVMLDDLFRE